MPELDDLDRRLLELVSVDASRPLRELGDLVGLSPSAVQRRLTRLRASGVIRAEIAVLDPRAIGQAMTTLALVCLVSDESHHFAAFTGQIRAEPAVVTCYHVAGQWDFAVVIRTADFDGYRRIAERLFLTNPAVQRYETLPVYATV
ncbi:Lrp/AsnC family transcriptional regulator [Actinoplanes sp. NEAU-A12]|uniref:Lrp/AsnC family transcriptional regulator n=1 Tax=Actinoplanes sandaracinus TaxID=3045177 RepID=A0ABT6WRL2_9ACTN|nr:Lrp/AsnC family transcriptional regulator [Actinoplanes sandaracinus]MDI6102321.1 Lrp/AsnC family transcriptional regulator [Actinoplanes sandaracinus]